MRRFDTEKPVSPNLGLEPRPVAPSSRISPPEPVEAPGNGAIAVGWLCVSTFSRVCTSCACAPYSPLVPCCRAKKRLAGAPSSTAALSEYATTVPSGCAACVLRIMPNSDTACGSPSIVQLALKILWRQCSELACANIISSTSVGSRPSSWNASSR
jgi:hypothetical protein